VCTYSVVEALKEKGNFPQLVKNIVVTDKSIKNKVPVNPDLNEYQEQPRLTTQSLVTVCNWETFLNASTLSNEVSAAYAEPKLAASDDPAVLLYSFGSTGRPKGVIFTQKNLYLGASSISDYLDNTNTDRFLALMPFSFDYGLSQLTSAIYAGATLVLFDYIVPKGVIDAVVRYKITGIPAVPHVWSQLARLKWPMVEHLRYVTCTRGRLEQNTIAKLEQL